MLRYQRRRLGGVDYYLGLDEKGVPTTAALELSHLQGRASHAPHELISRLQSPAATLRPPVDPGKIVCVGLNYVGHAKETGQAIPDEPLIFLKAPSAVIASGETILLPPQSTDVHYEGELAVVIGKRLRRATEDSISDAIVGYTLMNDVTARDIQRRESRYTRAKGFDTFAPLGPTIVRGLTPERLEIETRVNGEVRQSASLSDLVFSVPKLVAWISSIMTLEPGDVVSTGTPSGVGPLADGDLVEVEIPEIGILSNVVSAS